MPVGRYDPLLVALSLLVAVLASYTAFDLTSRVVSTRGIAARIWLWTGAIAMGVGIWSMHFLGMLALQLPGPFGYDPALTFASLLIAIAASGFGLARITRATLPLHRLAAGGLLLGLGIAAMQYVGMAALLRYPAVAWQPVAVLASLALGVTVSAVALWLAFQLRTNRPGVRRSRLIAAAAMGLAIAGTHYTRMMAVDFPLTGASTASHLDPETLALIIGVGSLCLIVAVLLSSLLDARHESRAQQLIASLERANHELTQLALQDPLTRLPNSLLLEDRISQAQRKADRDSSLFAVLFLDLDGFKTVNDSLGRQFGDLVLIESAQRLAAEVRAQDTLARLGGDQFAVVVEGLEQAEDVAQLCERLADTHERPFDLGRHQLRLSLSMGIAVYPQDGQDPHTLLSRAEAAMDRVKHAGRNGYRFFEATMDSSVHGHLELQNALRQALAEREFLLHYQPKFDALSGQIVGVEALIRWLRPGSGMVSPAQFIPAAERSGLILAIGDWALDEACRQMRAWYDQGHRFKMAVNLSAQQFRHARLIETVRATLARHELPPAQLVLEITETTAMEEAETAMGILRTLAEMGVGLSIDDFGTGYSSLAYLKRLPAGELKIDRAFVGELTPGSEDAAIVQAIIALGHTLGRTIVAEGVETVEQRDFLAVSGCDTLQGFLLGRPTTATALSELLAGSSPYKA
ncbi:putative bifunctional diguanylate cyclase/phosphodiesterase [Chitinimonas lacunae]|uniref:Bifunctional diguanylate cyclase/phosphodiesterase n=1 Tax=Chitinimonas lacunae TaxID=1963018 RepID=A0ABV8MTU3_9NEIS